MHPAHEQHQVDASSDAEQSTLPRHRGNLSHDFGPAGYHPQAVDAFVASVAERLDEVQVAYLHVLTELDRLKKKSREGTATSHSVQRLPAGADLGDLQALADHFDRAANVIRTELDTAARRAGRVIGDARTNAENIVDTAKREAAAVREEARLVYDNARAESAQKIVNAQSSADRLLQRAHERATELSVGLTLDRLDDPNAEKELVLNETLSVGSVLTRIAPGTTALAATAHVSNKSFTADTASAPSVSSPAPVEQPVKLERTFEALWNATSEQTDPNIERYFRPSPFKIVK